jgi:cell division protein FtsQ
MSKVGQKAMTKKAENQLVLSPVANVNEPEKAPLAIGLPIFLLTIALLVYATFATYQWLQDEQKLPVQDLVFSGDLQVLQSQTLEKLIRTELTSSFFALDVNDVHQLMESQAWVFSASVRKRWPSKLYVHIVEQKAVARWNDDLLLNKYGNTFDGLASIYNLENQQQNEVLQALPQLFGPGGSEKTALTGYTHMQGLLNASGQQIAQLILSERFAWQAKLRSDIMLRLGRQDYINRLQRFIDVYPLMLEKSEQDNTLINYVDLRYDTGLAVGWQEKDNKNINTNSARQSTNYKYKKAEINRV